MCTQCAKGEVPYVVRSMAVIDVDLSLGVTKDEYLTIGGPLQGERWRRWGGGGGNEGGWEGEEVSEGRMGREGEEGRDEERRGMRGRMGTR